MEHQSLFSVNQFAFPYRYKFPGQASDEQILFVTRENPIVLTVKRVMVLLISGLILVLGWWLGMALGAVGLLGGSALLPVALAVSISFSLIGWWWVTKLWQRSIALLTTKRLIKFIYTTPVNRHTLSLPLDMVVDTGSYTKGFIQALFQLGTFTARSAAAGTGVASDEQETASGSRINRKYFYIENIAHAEDLQHYVNKVLYAFRQHQSHLPSFRPFIPHLKGDARKRYMEQFPEYWS